MCVSEIVSHKIDVLGGNFRCAGILDITAGIAPRGAIGDNIYVVKNNSMKNFNVFNTLKTNKITHKMLIWHLEESTSFNL